MQVSFFTLCLTRLKSFRADEDGAVTTDFVVLTGSVMLMGLAHAHDVARGSLEIAGKVDECLLTDVGDNLGAVDAASYRANLEAMAAGCNSR